MMAMVMAMMPAVVLLRVLFNLPRHVLDLSDAWLAGGPDLRQGGGKGKGCEQNREYKLLHINSHV
jgi:hypothetical protein